METSRETDSIAPPPMTDQVVVQRPGTFGRASPIAAPTLVGENLLPVRNRLQWGPVAGGVVSAMSAFLLLTVLGIALGASVLEPRDTGEEIGRWAAAWGAFSVIAAFLIGGWIAARTASVEGSFAALMNGFVAGATALLLVIWLSFSGLGNLFGTIGASVGAIANAAAAAVPAAVTPGEVQTATGVDPANPDAAIDQAGQAAQEAADQAGRTLAAADNPQTFEAVRNGAIGTFLGLLLPLVAATLGGFMGKHTRQELVIGSGA